MRREAAQKRPPRKNPVPGKLEPGTIEYARTCYRHMAGWFGVALTDAMEKKGILTVENANSYRVTPCGIRWLEASFGILVPAATSTRQRIAVQCLDGTERRPHLAGWLGRALYQNFLQRHWVVPIEATRALRVTPKGKRHIQKLLRETIAPPGLCSS